jgi:hypothetical protein
LTQPVSASGVPIIVSVAALKMASVLLPKIGT